MKKLLLIAFLAFASQAAIAQTATDFTANDCSGTSHNLFTDLDAGKVIVLVWVMPCGACTGPALTTYNVVQSYQLSNPNTVYMYLCDDYANTSCSSINSWANSNGMTNSTRFSNSVIDMLDYGSTGMPKIVVLGGASHTVFYNANNTVNSTALQNAINSALAVAGVNEQNSNISSLQVVPNPAGSSAEIKFNLVKTSEVTVELYNLEGKMVKGIYSGKLNAGENQLKVNLEKITAGMYLVKYSDGDKSRFINLVKAD